MIEHDSPALKIALAYHTAWTSHDFELAMTFIADDIVCHTPADMLDGVEAFRSFMGPFEKSLVSSELIAAFGDNETAMLMYHTETMPVKNAPGAECLTVRNGKVARMTIVFDRLPFAEARRAAAAR